MRHEAGLAVGQVLAEDLRGVAAGADLDDVAREVGARDQVRVADIFQRALEGAVNADPGQLGGHLAGAALAPAAGRLQAAAQSGVVLVEAQADDVHRLVGEGHRDLHAAQEGHACGVGGGAGAGDAADLVMVGQGPQLHPVGAGPGGQILGAERAVGHDRVAVQVGVEEAGAVHRAIVGASLRMRPSGASVSR